jgi:cytochrome P450
MKNVADIVFAGAFGGSTSASQGASEGAWGDCEEVDGDTEHREAASRYLQHCCDYNQQWIELTKDSLVWCDEFEHLPLAANIAYRQQGEEVMQLLHEAVERERASQREQEQRGQGQRGQEQGFGLLGMLVQAEDAHGHGLTDVEVAKNCLAYLAAGSQDAGNGLVHVLYALAGKEGQSTQQELAGQLQSAFAGVPPTYEELKCCISTTKRSTDSDSIESSGGSGGSGGSGSSSGSVPLLVPAIKESLRLYPHMNFLFPRRRRDEMQLGGYKVRNLL